MQYRRVSIPSVGTITLVQQPAQLNVVDKVILPPGYTAELTQEDNIPEHQLFFLSAALEEERGNVLQRMAEIGQQLNKQVQAGGFYWKGIGLLTYSREPVPIALPTLSPITAERVLRPGAEHNVLVGDHQRTSTQMSVLKEEVAEVVEKERSILVIIGWIVLLLSIAYIIFVLYQGRFRVGSTGSRQVPTSSLLLQEDEVQKVFSPVTEYL